MNSEKHAIELIPVKSLSKKGLAFLKANQKSEKRQKASEIIH